MLDQRLPTPDTYTAYEVLVREARTRSRRTRFLQAGLVAAAAVAVVATGQLGGAGLDPAPAPAPVDRPSTSASAEPATGLDGWEDVTGTWSARDVSVASMAAHLESLGRPDTADELRRNLPRTFEDGVDLSLEFHLGRASLSADGDEIDLHHYSVEGDGTLYLRPLTAPGGRARLAARLEGDQLRLVFLDTTVPPRGVSEQLMVTALYTTVPFERVGS